MANNHTHPPRRVEIDLLRSLAIAGMIAYHLLFDLQVFFETTVVDVYSLPATIFARGIASLFLILSGISFFHSWENAKQNIPNPLERYAKYLRRGVILFACGAAVSLVTYASDPHTYVRFGILHLIAVSMVLLPILTRFRLWNILIAVVFIGVTPLITSQRSTSMILLAVGMPPPNFTTVDYFPLFPWLGLLILGYSMGQLYYGKIRRGLLGEKPPSAFMRILLWPGQHSLLIYLAHQPILFLFLHLFLRSL